MPGLNIIGIVDVSEYVKKDRSKKEIYRQFEYKLEELKLGQNDKYNILISHRPELIKLYSKYEYDLVFSGHAHGGQFRIPFIGGIYAPMQGLFPKYTSGVIEEGKTKLVVSRGLGNTTIPIRVFNQPEVVNIILKNKDSI